MGQGDRKTRKGKIWRSSYGNKRPHSPAKKTAAADKAGSLAARKKKK